MSSWRKDRREAVRHYEHARELLETLAAKKARSDSPEAAKQRALIERERIGVNFDLVTTLAQRDAHRYGRWGWCRWWWDSALEAEEDSEAVEEADYEEPNWWHYAADDSAPTGIPLGPDGKPQFVQTPKTYRADRPASFIPAELDKPSGRFDKKMAATVATLTAPPCRTLNPIAIDSGMPSSSAPSAIATPLPSCSCSLACWSPERFRCLAPRLDSHQLAMA